MPNGQLASPPTLDDRNATKLLMAWLQNPDAMKFALGLPGAFLLLTSVCGWGLLSPSIERSHHALTNPLWLAQLGAVISVIAVVVGIIIDDYPLGYILAHRDQPLFVAKVISPFLLLGLGIALYVIGRQRSPKLERLGDLEAEEARSQWRLLIALLMRLSALASGCFLALLGLQSDPLIVCVFLVLIGGAAITVGMYSLTLSRRCQPATLRLVYGIYGFGLLTSVEKAQDVFILSVVRTAQGTLVVVILYIGYRILRQNEQSFTPNHGDGIGKLALKKLARTIRSLPIKFISSFILICGFILLSDFDSTSRSLVIPAVTNLLQSLASIWQAVRAPFYLFSTFVSFGILPYWLKSAHSVLYGLIELFFATGAIGYALENLAKGKPANGSELIALLEQNLIALIAGLYVMVRGLDNIGKGIRDPYASLWKALFETKWLYRKQRCQGWQDTKSAFILYLKS